MSDFPKIIAHRGASTIAPENTIAAFAKASEIGARWCECDVGVMADGTLLVIHDDTVDRTTNSSGSWDSWGYGELRRLDAGAWFSPTYRFERIPELADVVSFANATQTSFNIELKPRAAGKRRDTLVENLQVALQSFENKGGLLISSFDHELLSAVRQAMPEVPLAWLCTPAEVRAESWREASQIECTAIHPCGQDLTEADVHEMLDAGFDVNVWTVNTLEDARKAAQWGVTGIFTDRVQDFPAEALARV